MLADLLGLNAKYENKGKIIVKDLLDCKEEYRELQYISLNDSTEHDLIEIVIKNIDPKNSKKLRYIPVVDSINTLNLLYIIKTADLKQYCEIYYGPLDGIKQK